MGSNPNTIEFIQRIFIIDAIVSILYLLTKWGTDLIDSVLVKEENAQQLLKKLESTMAKIEKSTTILSHGISSCNENIGVTRTSSENISITVHEIAKGAEMEAATEEILAEIEEQNYKIINIQDSISELDNLCSELKTML